MQKFDYRAYFDRVQDMKKLQVRSSDITWLERYEKPARRYENVLYLGCNILRTPHIAQQVVRVFELLELDFVAVGGVQYCCGIIWDSSDDIAKGQAVSSKAITRLESYGPDRVVMWCPSCNVHFSDTVRGRDGRKTAFEITHATRFLADLAQQRGGLPWQREVKQRVVLHAHAGREGHTEGQRRARADREAATALLQTVPGLELVDVVVSEPELDYDCGPVAPRLGTDRFRSHQRATLERALRLGVDQVVTISHACQREWCGENTGQLGFRNYISIVAEALGLPVDPDLLSMFRAGLTTDEIVEASRPAWISHGMTAEQARAMVERYTRSGDLSGYSVDLSR
ncbi:heterodisulfide reductase-related iron-sulfur binding cluster [Streptomyces sp. NPDC090075]|uniref:heterodisulfide reductase-related iron-sulfur binding cluster n=1 Tax=Streptomyces sp. NPDC090075 TaxID=3365937 RepID=UPI003810AB75